MSLQQRLFDCYYEILNTPEHQNFLMETALDKQNGLDKLFLAGVPESYEHAKYKILVVGRETRGWYNDTDVFEFNLAEYIQKGMEWSQGYLLKRQEQPRNSKGLSFFNFIRKISKAYGSDGLAWANTYAFAHKKKSPRKSPYFKQIEHISGLLLMAQIEILKPDVIIFAGGGKSVASRRKYLQQDNGKNIQNQKIFEGFANKYLWKFELDTGTVCFRVSHPSARQKEVHAAHRYMIKIMFPSEADQDSQGRLKPFYPKHQP
ncbi:hypothetical protein [Neisseria perflava]|uniref:hypothetical protein n=1 Tax=Neisseria perflava TaxID=33053 RepID=UPI00209FA5DD|nr:hypothetical protein [Neisseria perflava]MCP1660838.1 hypothetical protein [Neisseria perflava]MCP1772519.1 hypothetical protein [Neisseria perflava]